MDLTKAAVLLCVLATPALASPFQYGDVFVSTPSGILRFNQSGTLLQTIAGGGQGIGFDFSGNLYAAEGSTVAKFDNSGNPLGTFASGFPGSVSNAEDIDFDSAGNAYVAGIQDLNNDFLYKYSSTGVLIGTRSFVEGQENFVYLDVTRDGRVLVTPGTANIIDVFNATTLASLPTINGPSNRNGGIQSLPGGGFLVSSSSIYQYNAAGVLVGTYSPPVSGDFIGIDSFTATNYWAVTDFGEVRNLNVGSPAILASFSTGTTARDIAIYTLPEPATWLGLASGLFALALLSRKQRRAA